MEKCMMCGKEHDDARLALPLLHGMCFSCSFWYRILKGRRPYVVIDGHCYRVAPEDRGGFRGFGGFEYTIKFNDGNVVKTTNLWHRGKVDCEFMPFFPNTAEFVNPNDGMGMDDVAVIVNIDSNSPF